MSERPHPLEAALAAAWPPEAWQEVTVLLAVSGGADSVALLRAMLALKCGGVGRVLVAHCNHQLRGEESAADEAFVVELCRKWGVAREVGHVDVARTAAGAGDGVEAAARQARYHFLEHTAARLGARYLVTAHTADDQAETILHRILRGTGIGGLAGMERARPLGPLTLIRPLLGMRRGEVLRYLEDLGQPYRHDASNADLRFTRNRIRHELLPHLAENYNASVVESLLRLGALAGEAQAVVDRLVADLVEQCVARRGTAEMDIDTTRLASQPAYVVRELFMAAWRQQQWPMQAMGFAQWELLRQMAGESLQPAPAVHPKHVFPGAVLAEAGEGWLRLRRSDTARG